MGILSGFMGRDKDCGIFGGDDECFDIIIILVIIFIFFCCCCKR
ncbi:hypothetical protein [Candidatus Formimonas warabiya]|nr:hypothetical protein [Candidatus Formimonas warabiya]